MQINNNRQPDFYPPVPLQQNRSGRLPIVYDAEVQARTDTPERPDNTTVVPATTASDDSRQARFVRSFISSDRRFDGDSSQPQASLLPRAVQQYLYINQLPDMGTTQQGQLVDERV
jgi:hypothetical protein